jgi:hypothetical protein
MTLPANYDAIPRRCTCTWFIPNDATKPAERVATTPDCTVHGCVGVMQTSVTPWRDQLTR